MKINSLIKISVVGITILLVVTGIVFSCKEKKKEKIIKEGIIEFDAKVIDYNHPLAELAPSTATLKFKKDKYIMEMTAMGIFKNNYICNLTNKTLIQVVNFLDLKQATIETESEIRAENKDYKLIIEETKQTKMIAGFKCKKVIVRKEKDTSEVFDAYYSEELGSDNPNSLNPYEAVKGTLLQYRLSKMGLEMEFTAVSVKHAQIPDNYFELPITYKIISKDEMHKFFEQF